MRVIFNDTKVENNVEAIRVSKDSISLDIEGIPLSPMYVYSKQVKKIEIIMEPEDERGVN